MSETVGGEQNQRWGIFAGMVLGLFLLNRLRKRRKIRKIAKMRARAVSEGEKKSGKKEKARRKARVKARMKAEEKAAKRRKKERKEKKNDRSLIEQLARFAVLQFAKKIISQQIRDMEISLGKSKLGSKLVESAESAGT